MKRLEFKILVIGAGPAGLAAATSAAKSTSAIGLIDDNPVIGGQIWRGGVQSTPTEQARRWFEETGAVTVLNSARVIALLKPGVVVVETATHTLEVHFERLIIATGARELFLPFPGWTLPGVMGAGGLQALVKGGLPIGGKRVVVAGTGPLLLAVAAYLRRKGAQVQLIAEQTSWRKLSVFALQLLRYPDHIIQASRLSGNLFGVPLRANCWVSQAHGTERLEAVTLHQGDRTSTIACDYFACGFGLVPNIELPTAFGCAIVDGAVQVDKWQQSSLQSVYCAGEVTGVGGLDLSLIEGQIAGFAAAGKLDEARKCFPARDRARRFATLLERSFVLRSELKTLAEDTTIVCRCEDVRYQDLSQYSNWRSAKLHTRCGMGPCQGRVCGAATAFLFGWTPTSVRPPVTAARIMSLARVDTGSSHDQVKGGEA
jgi:NADPH-dependent 2,4-dienoyl-CoA reductase/sulfur reductase-like enzyme